MKFRPADLGIPRRPFVVALVVTVLFSAGLLVVEQTGLFGPAAPVDTLTASVLPGAVVALTNHERTNDGLGTLKASELLNRAAQLKADDMAAKSYYAHVSPDGTIPPQWLTKVGYTFQIMGENLVVDRESSQEVVSAWMGSEAHRENILNPQFTEIGIGIAYGNYKNRDTTYVVQMLARPQQMESAPRVVVAPTKPLISTKPFLPTPLPTRSAATTSVLVRAPAPKPVVKDTITPILNTVASSTLAEVPSIIADVTVTPLPVIPPYSSEPIELSPTTTEAAAPPAAPLGTRLKSFMRTVSLEMRSFFSPLF